MRNRNRYILALGMLGAVGCLSSASVVDEALVNVGGVPSTVVYAQEDDPFADDEADSSDPFADDEADSSDPFAGEGSEEDSPFDSDSNSGPFAPSAISTSSPTPPVAAGPKAKDKDSAEGEKSDDPRAKYLRPEDVPDELKTEDDFLKSLNAAENAIMGEKPENAAELFSAAARIARVGRPLFAKILVEKALTAPDAEPEEAAAILDSLGSGRATYLIALPEIGPAGAQLYEKVSAVARKAWEGETALREAIDRAKSGSTADRAAAIVDLRKGGAAALALLIQDLSGGESDVATAKELIPFFESDAVEALLQTVRNADLATLVPAISVLGDMQDLRVGPELLALLYDGSDDSEVREALMTALAKQYKELPTEADFVRSTYEKALGFFKRTEVLPKTVDGETVYWSWDENADVPVKENVPVEVAFLEEAARLAQLAYRVGVKVNALPTGARDLAIVATSELEFNKNGDAASGLAELQDIFTDVDVDALQSAIRSAIDYDRCQAALLPTIWLRDVGNENCVYSYGEPAPIVKASLCADRRVRYEAISAIVKWAPKRSYIGSVKVGRMLEWFTTSTGSKYAVVASPKLDECGRIGNLLQQQGYKIRPVTTGRDALLVAQSCADVELVFITAKVSSPDARVIAQTLRADVRTSDVPLLVGTSEDGEDTAMNLLVGKEPNAFVYPTPYDLESCSMATQRLFDYAKPSQVPADVRFAQAQNAAKAYLALSKSNTSIYEFDRANELIRRFLSAPEFFDLGLEYAASIATNYAQNALIDVVADNRFTIEQRQKAVEAFQRQLAANGSMLRGPEIKKMYERYNASEKESTETQKVLSDLLDVYENATEK